MDLCTSTQVRAIRSLSRQVFKDDSAYRDWLYMTFFKDDIPAGKRKSTKQLLKYEASIAIKLLLGSVPKGKKKAHSSKRRSAAVNGGAPAKKQRYVGTGVGGLLTQNQANAIAALEYTLGWSNNPARLLGFIERTLKNKMTVEWLTNRQASKMITAMKSVLRSK